MIPGSSADVTRAAAQTTLLNYRDVRVGTAVKNRVYKGRFLAQMVSDLSAIFMSSWAFVCSMLG